MTTKPKTSSAEADFDATAILQAIAADATAPAGARVAAARTLVIHAAKTGKAGKAALEAAEAKAAGATNRAALRIVAGKRRE